MSVRFYSVATLCHVVSATEVVMARDVGYTDLGAGCCEGGEGDKLTAATYLGLEDCQVLCRLNEKCGYIVYGWPGSKFCQLLNTNSKCSAGNLQVGAQQCGEGGGNTGVRTYQLVQEHGPPLRTMSDGDAISGFPDQSDLAGVKINAPGGDSPLRLTYGEGSSMMYWQEQQKKHEKIREINLAMCVINSLQSAEYIALVTLTIKASTVMCEPNYGHEDRCAGDILGIIASFTGIASFISGAVALCPESANLQAACASTITGLIRSILLIAQASTQMKWLCIDGLAKPPSKGPNTPARKKDWKTATCAIEAIAAATWLAKAGAGIADSVEACDSPDRTKCAASALGVTGSFLSLGSFLGPVAYDCAKGIDPGALCSHDIFKLVGGLNDLAKDAIAMESTCGPVTRRLHEGEVEEHNATAHVALKLAAKEFLEFMASNPEFKERLGEPASFSGNSTSVLVV